MYERYKEERAASVAPSGLSAYATVTLSVYETADTTMDAVSKFKILTGSD